MTGSPTALLYDWDNTLVDGWAGITAALNAVFHAFAMPEWSVADARARVRVSLRDSFPVMFGADWERARDIFYATLEARHLHHVAPMRCVRGAGGRRVMAAGGCVEQGRTVSPRRGDASWLVRAFWHGDRRRRCRCRQAGCRADPAGARSPGSRGRSLGVVPGGHRAGYGGRTGCRCHCCAGRRRFARWWD